MTDRKERVAVATPWVASAAVLACFFFLGFALPH